MGTSDVDPDQAKQVTSIVVIVALLMNAAFYFLSSAYYADRAATLGGVSDAVITKARLAFAAMSGCVALSAIASQFLRRLVPHAITGLVGSLAIVGAVFSATKFHAVLPASLGLVGFLMLALTWGSYSLRSRAAWSFLIGASAVGALVTLSGATKIRNALEIGLWYALILPGVLVVATVMLVAAGDDYAER